MSLLTNPLDNGTAWPPHAGFEPILRAQTAAAALRQQRRRRGLSYRRPISEDQSIIYTSETDINNQMRNDGCATCGVKLIARQGPESREKRFAF